MTDLFNDILALENVEGVLLFSPEGDLSFQRFTRAVPTGVNRVDWPRMARVVNGIREAEIIFENKRIYIRKTATGHLMVVMRNSAPAAMVRLHTDLILPAMKKKSGSARLRRFLHHKQPDGPTALPESRGGS
jgi:hypothetical protein